jgi:hypothetical protein
MEAVDIERALFDIGLRLDVSNWQELSENERAFAVLDLLSDGTDLYEYYYWQVGVGAAHLPAAAQRMARPSALTFLCEQMRCSLLT